MDLNRRTRWLGPQSAPRESLRAALEIRSPMTLEPTADDAAGHQGRARSAGRTRPSDRRPPTTRPHCTFGGEMVGSRGSRS
jgi:hypothetical protein